MTLDQATAELRQRLVAQHNLVGDTDDSAPLRQQLLDCNNNDDDTMSRLLASWLPQMAATLGDPSRMNLPALVMVLRRQQEQEEEEQQKQQEPSSHNDSSTNNNNH